jgi:putative nucleotidyltransferase with HDIG domain
LALTSLALVVNPPPIGIVEGTPAPRTYRATRAIQYVDEQATEDAKAAAAAASDPVYVQDVQAASGARATVSDFLSAVITARQPSEESTGVVTVATRDEQIEDLTEEFGDTVDAETIARAVDLDDGAVATVDAQTRELVTLILTGAILEPDMEETKARLATNADLLDLPRAQRLVVSGVGQASLRPTLVLDEEATAVARETAEEAVEDVVIARQAGENIVQQGQVVTPQHIELLKILGVFDSSADLPAILASIALLAMMISAVGFYLAFYELDVWHRLADLGILATMLLGTVAVTRGIVYVAPEISPYLLPFPVVAMLTTVLINARVGLLAAIMATIAGSLLGFSSGVYVVAVLLVNVVATVAMSRMRVRSHLFYAGAFVVLTMGVVASGATLASTSSWSASLLAGAYGLLGGLLATVLTYGLLPFFEVVFHVTTDIKLLELSNPGHPLLRELMVAAPGTYNHSVLTANLAEAAAEDIGANPLLTRVGSFYHDIGKIKRPMFFVENQIGIDNPHDTTSPTLSSLVITAHVKEGIELARKHKLPPEVIDIIRQHHGTSLVSYFYNKANESGDDVPETDFRYDAERPKSREAALVMLADAAEASVRALENPTVARIEQTIRKVVQGKVGDGQLDGSQLTLSDIETITLIYAKMLSGVYHRRMKYPEGNGRVGDALRRASAEREEAASEDLQAEGA